MTSLSELATRFGVSLPELNGTAFSAEIPLPAAVINRFLTQKLAATQGPIANALVEPRGDQRIDITLALRGQRLLPTLRIAARIEQQPQFPHPAILGLRWSLPGMGPLGLFAGPALSFFKKLPPGIQVEADRLSVDLGELLRTQGLGELIDYVTALEILTRDGGFILRVAARIAVSPRQ